MKNRDWREILEGLKGKVDNIKEDISVSLDIMFSDKEYVLTVWKWTKRIALIGIGALITTTVTVSNGEYNDMKEELNSKCVEQIKSSEYWREKSEELQPKYNELSRQVEKAKEYLELDENEKALVDAKIVEVNQATEDQLAQEKAQKEAEEKAKKEAEEEAKRQAEEEEERQKAEAEAHKYETGLTWEQIAREGKVGTLGKFEGKILQVISTPAGFAYRVAINGDYDQVMYVDDTLNMATETLLEGDYVYFKGMSMGTTTYTTVMGANVTIPAFLVDEINR